MNYQPNSWLMLTIFEQYLQIQSQTEIRTQTNTLLERKENLHCLYQARPTRTSLLPMQTSEILCRYRSVRPVSYGRQHDHSDISRPKKTKDPTGLV
jgi:hypothetical protein